MSRFDPDSDWPDAQRRHVNGSVHRANVPGGQPCPEAGWWFTPARPDSYRYFSQGEIMPSLDGD